MTEPQATTLNQTSTDTRQMSKLLPHTDYTEQYRVLSDVTYASCEALPAGTIYERYQEMMQQKYAQMDAHRQVFVAVFQAGLNEDDKDFVRISGTNDPMHRAISLVVDGASDVPNAQTRDAFVNVLYVFYLLLMLFRLYDHTPRHQASDHLLNFISDAFKLVRPMMIMPVFANTMRKLSAILLLVFGGRTYETPATTASDTPPSTPD